MHRDDRDLDNLIDEIITDAHGEDEKLWAFRQRFCDDLDLPMDAHIVGEPISVIAVIYHGNVLRGLTLLCRNRAGAEYEVSTADVEFPADTPAAILISAYRRWLNLEPIQTPSRKPVQKKRKHKVKNDEIDLSKPVDLVVLSVMRRSAQCRLLDSDRVITLRASVQFVLFPGIIATVKPKKQWRYGGHPYLSGEILSTRIDAKAMNLVPLKLEDWQMWDPDEEYWGEDDEQLAQWEQEIIDFGPRPLFEMEQVLPGMDPEDPFDDPILRHVEYKHAGDWDKAHDTLMNLCRDDLRCLDAHAHLGHMVFDTFPEVAIQHYEIGVRIGELSLGNNFNSVLLWSLVDNRPFLRCMQGYGLCLWRLERFDEALEVFQRILWMNPRDNQGIRFLIDCVRDHELWNKEEC